MARHDRSPIPWHSGNMCWSRQRHQDHDPGQRRRKPAKMLIADAPGRGRYPFACTHWIALLTRQQAVSERLLLHDGA